MSGPFYIPSCNTCRFQCFSTFATILSISVILIMTILVCVAVSHYDLICILIMTNDVEHLFMCVLGIYISLLKYVLKCFAHF